jgi:hypothetical protein
MTDERARIAELYITSTHTSNLRSTERTRRSAADIIAAAGLASKDHELPIMLWHTIDHPRRTSIGDLERLLIDELDGYANRKKIRVRSTRVARQVIHWLLFGVCKRCNGTGWERIHNTPHNSDEPCIQCHGTTRIELKTDHDEAAKWIISRIESLQSEAEHSISRRL